ncbi:MAG: XdhC/CoxI family protein [Bacteroidia bacterium]|nr:XdhC/CoxI family protein [Bacteroidia bacterium]
MSEPIIPYNHKPLKSALCIIVDTRGSTPRKAGTKMRVFENGTIEGSISGGALEKKIIEDAITQIKIGSPKLFEHQLLQQHHMCCGGMVKVYIEPEEVQKKLVIFGAGHVGQELANQAVKADFDVSVYDDRAEYIQQINHKQVHTHCIDFAEALKQISFDDNTYIAIMTYRHDIDRALLRYCLRKEHAYLGFIGSQRKILLTRKMLLQEGVASEDELDKVDMPIGLNIGAETPYEIAVSIIAKLIEVKNMGSVNMIKQIKQIEQCIKGQP